MLQHMVSTSSANGDRFRSTNNNLQDYVPLYRYLPKGDRGRTAINDRQTRDLWLNELYQKVVDRIATGQETNCISAGLLKEKESSNLSESEIKSINVSFVSGGFETLAISGLACISYLSTKEGQLVQEKAYEDIIAHHGDADRAWDECLLEEKSPYVVALVREGLRYYTPLPLLNPRQTIKPFQWRSIHIPQGLSVHINTQSVNHDPACYGPDAHVFRPERWLEEDEGDLKKPPGPPYQFSFGAGSRMCPAVGISNRILYATYVRLLLHFRLKASEEQPPVVDYVGFNEDPSGQSAIPKRFKIQLILRDSVDTFEKHVGCSQG